MADDIRDVACDPLAIGKPVGQDEIHGRPSAVRELDRDSIYTRLFTYRTELTDAGLEGSAARLDQQISALSDEAAARTGPSACTSAARGD